ncbi:MAG: hypothetical protein J0I06_02970 [Planctomycetes bacterium]|nr:hypothetical protein [Planctomycetota bacterium]
MPPTTEATEPRARSEVADALQRLVAVSDSPPGFAGRSRVPVRSGNNNEYDTVEDRWRLGFPTWDRYDQGHPRVFDYPYTIGALFDPFRQNVLKGDYPIYGQHTFLNVSGSATYLFEGRSVPTAVSPPLAGSPRPLVRNFFSRDGQFAHSELYLLSFDLFHGDTAFKPADWRVRLTPAFGLNSVSAQTLRVVSPDPGAGNVLVLGRPTLQEWFAEYKIAETSSAYDFVSVRAGAQPFTSDFRGFVYSDVNRGVRLFGNADANRTQYNLAYFRQLDKDSATQLNTFRDRDQNIVIANLYRQDFVFPGYNVEGSFHYNNDGPDIQFARNGSLVRPDPVGARQPHRVEAYYLGLAGDGHIGRLSLSHAAYWVLGRDGMNPIAGRPQSISAGMAALELSYTADWIRFRTSGFWASGDGNARDGRAHGFDSILDNTNFAGAFSYFRRQRVALFGVGLPNDQSLYPDMRASRVQGQSNFVNPGLWLVNAGVDFEVTPAFRLVNNANFLWFDRTNAIETFTQLGHINRQIGLDLSSGWEYRPRLNNNCIITSGLATLIPGAGYRRIYNPTGSGSNLLLAGFVEMSFAF